MKQIETETDRNDIKKMDRMNKKEYRRFPVLDQSTFWYIGWIRRKIYYTSETTFVFSLSIFFVIITFLRVKFS